MALSWKRLKTSLKMKVSLIPQQSGKVNLCIFYTAQSSPTGLIYHAAAGLLDIDDPCNVLAHLKKPLFEPTEPYEKVGVVNNIAFLSGSALFDDELYIYYGAADLTTAVASMSITALLNELKHQKK